jgi:hypothetical protein
VRRASRTYSTSSFLAGPNGMPIPRRRPSVNRCRFPSSISSFRKISAYLIRSGRSNNPCNLSDPCNAGASHSDSSPDENGSQPTSIRCAHVTNSPPRTLGRDGLGRPDAVIATVEPDLNAQYHLGVGGYDGRTRYCVATAFKLGFKLGDPAGPTACNPQKSARTRR